MDLDKKRAEMDRPFAPPQEQTLIGLLGWVLIFLVLVCVSFSGRQSWLDRNSVGKPGRVETGSDSSQFTARAPAQSPDAQQQPLGAKEESALGPGIRVVTKCVINGKTTYGDERCPQGATTGALVTKADHNLMAGLTASQPAAPTQVPSEQASHFPITPAGNVTLANASECKILDEEIALLDSIARQPQSGQMQDEITRRKRAHRDRQLRIRC
ncbi:MAG: hypothetical protein V4731_05105 [Pseudomonadota bacterium]